MPIETDVIITKVVAQTLNSTRAGERGALQKDLADGATTLEASFFVQNEMREFFRFAAEHQRALRINVLIPASADQHHAEDQADSLAAVQRRAKELLEEFPIREKVHVGGLENRGFSAALRFRLLTSAEQRELTE